MEILVVGRTGSGKDTVVRIMEEFGLKQLKSYTTRPQRDEEDANTHIFITNEEYAEKYKYSNDILAYTMIGDYRYFSTKEQFDESDVYIVDPCGIDYFIGEKKVDIEDLIIVNVVANKKIRQERTSDRNEYDFDEREKSEDMQFSRFEDESASGKYRGVPVFKVYNQADGAENIRETVEEIVKKVHKDENE